MRQNGRRLQILRADDMIKQDTDFIASCQVSCIHYNTFILKERLKVMLKESFHFIFYIYKAEKLSV